MLSGDHRLPVRRQQLNHLMRTPVSKAMPIRIGTRNGLRRVATRADDPAADLARLNVIRHGRRLIRQQRWRFLPVADENNVGLRTLGQRRAHGPVNALPDLAGIRPAHGPSDVIERRQQIVVVGADLDRRKQQ